MTTCYKLNTTSIEANKAVDELHAFGFTGFGLNENDECVVVWSDKEFFTTWCHESEDCELFEDTKFYKNREEFLEVIKQELLNLPKEKEVQDLLKQFENMTLALAKDGAVIKQEITPEQANLLHMSVGVSGEAGELLDAIKKHVIYQKPLDVENVKEELGDLLFYMSNLMQSVGLSFEEVLQHNVDKLSVRYASGKYSNSQAQERADKV